MRLTLVPLACLLLLAVGGACTKKYWIKADEGVTSSPGYCAQIALAKGAGGTNAGGAIGTGGTTGSRDASGTGASSSKLPELCIEEIERGMLECNWSRVTIGQLDGKVACVRLTQSNGSSLGYDQAQDEPQRSELELVPIAGEVRFLVSDSPGQPGDAGTPSDIVKKALGNALGGYDLRVELFNARCQVLCRESRGSTTIDFRQGHGSPLIRQAIESNEDCALLGSRAPATWNQGGSTSASVTGAVGSGGAAGEGGAGGEGGASH